MTTNHTSALPRILLVDDEPSVLNAIRSVLRSHFDVTTASNGIDALEAMKVEEPFAVVVSDMRMPLMNGAEFLRRACAEAPETVRMLLTGYADLDAAMSAVNEGRISRYLTKPCPPPELIEAIGEGVRQYEDERRERDFTSGERKHLSEKLMRAARLAAVASLAKGAGAELRRLADTHHSVLQRAIAGAAEGRPVQHGDLDELRRVDESLSRAVDCLVEFAPRDEQSVDEIDLAYLLRHASEAIRVLPGGDDVEVRVTIEAGVPTVLARKADLEAALLNIVTNAVEAVSRCERRSTIEFRLRYDLSTDEVVLEVMDNGIGIHPEARPFIMRPCFSGFGTKRVGLGLAVADELVHANQGRIEYESSFGEGTLFRIVLPAIVTSDADTREGPLPKAAGLFTA